MLWYFVAGEDQVDINMLVPIEILNLPANLTISNQHKKEIEVTVRGPRSIIQEMRSRNITRPVDLSGAKPGTIVIKNDENSIPMRRGIAIQRLQPKNITLLIDLAKTCQASDNVFPAYAFAAWITAETSVRRKGLICFSSPSVDGRLANP